MSAHANPAKRSAVVVKAQQPSNLEELEPLRRIVAQAGKQPKKAHQRIDALLAQRAGNKLLSFCKARIAFEEYCACRALLPKPQVAQVGRRDVHTLAAAFVGCCCTAAIVIHFRCVMAAQNCYVLNRTRWRACTGAGLSVALLVKQDIPRSWCTAGSSAGTHRTTFVRTSCSRQAVAALSSVTAQPGLAGRGARPCPPAWQEPKGRGQVSYATFRRLFPSQRCQAVIDHVKDLALCPAGGAARALLPACLYAQMLVERARCDGSWTKAANVLRFLTGFTRSSDWSDPLDESLVEGSAYLWEELPNCERFEMRIIDRVRLGG